MNTNFPMRRIAAISLLSMVLGTASAQTMTVNPGTLTAGGTMTVEYSDPSKAGKTVVITVAHSFPTQTIALPITLDGNGNGSASTTVPAANKVFVNGPNVPQQIILVN